MADLKTTPKTNRSATRLMAVQAMYQTMHTDASPAQAMDICMTTILDDPMDPVDKKWLKELITGTGKHLPEIDGMIAANLSENWKPERVSSILRSILRLAIYELWQTDTPPKVVINEYVDLAHAFFDEKEPKFINAMLDKISRTLQS